jgi:hypothetical protein
MSKTRFAYLKLCLCLGFVFLMLWGMGLGWRQIATAQRPRPGGDEIPPWANATPLPRHIEREAPRREPVILETRVISDDLSDVVIQLPTEADAFIASEWPNQKFGAVSLYLGYNLNGDNNYGAERTLLQFNLNEIPTGAVINEAHLRLYVNWSEPADDDPMGAILRRLASSWDEYAVTWNDEPAWGEIRASADVGSAIGWYQWDVTDLVAAWVAGHHPNHGMEIIGDERVQQRERAFHSRETSTSFYPRLVVDYTDYGDISPPAVYVDDLPAYVTRTFTVSWTGTDPGGSGIAYYDVQYRGDGGDWIVWITETEATEAQFVGGDGVFYEFRARGVDRAGNVEPFGDPEASTTVDASPPSVQMDPLPAITGVASFTVSWTGYDAGSGIQYYDVQYRRDGGDWIPWQQQTITTSAQFVAPEDGWYGFEARAVDHVGHVEPFLDRAEASVIVDAEPPFVVPRVWLPLVMSHE